MLVFLAFATTLYWLFELANATFVQDYARFFEPIKSFVNLFYQRSIITNDSRVDFSYLIATFTALLFAYVINFVIEGLKFIETKFNNIYHKIKKQKEDCFNTSLEKTYVKEENKNKNFLLIIKFIVQDLTKDSFYQRNAEESIKEKEKQVLMEFSKILNSSTRCVSKFLNDGLLLYFENIADIDKEILLIRETIKLMKSKYSKDGYKLTYYSGIDVYGNNNELIDKIKNLIIITRLGIDNKIVCLSTFRQRYNLIKTPRHGTESLGVYKINQNEEVFCIKSLK